MYYFFIKKVSILKKGKDFIGIKHERGWIPAASFGGLCLCSTFWHMWHVNCVFSSEGESRQRFLMTFPGKRRSKHILVFQNAVLLQKSFCSFGKLSCCSQSPPTGSWTYTGRDFTRFPAFKNTYIKVSSALRKLVLSWWRAAKVENNCARLSIINLFRSMWTLLVVCVHVGGGVHDIWTWRVFFQSLWE